MTEAINSTKDSIVESIDKTLSNGEFIPLKDADDPANHALEENLENLKNEMLTKTQSFSDETDKMADELIMETEDVIRDAETGMVELESGAPESMDNKSNHSADSLKTAIPEPEIERLLLEATNHPPSPEPTMTENLNVEVTEAEKPEEEDPKPDAEPEPEPEAEPEAEAAPTEPEAEPATEPEPENTEETAASEESPKENDLVVEDVKSEE